MKALKYILLLVLLIIVASAIYIATLESSYNVTRSKVMKAPKELVYTTVNDYKNWPAWSPWIEKDTSATLTFGEKTSGKGGSYGWNGSILGEGNMETLSTNINESIHQKIKFIKPFESESDIYWEFKPVDGGTEATWGMKGEMDFMFKAYTALNGSMDEKVGPDFERGLFKLDSILQVAMKEYNVTVDGITTHSGGYYLYNTTSCKIDELETMMQQMMPKIKAYVNKNRISIAGAPFTLYHKYDEKNNAVMFSCAIPISERVITESGSGILTGMLTPFKAVKTTLKGNTTNLKEAWKTTYNYLEEKGLEQVAGSAAMEVISIDASKTANPAEWVTEIYVPINE